MAPGPMAPAGVPRGAGPARSTGPAASPVERTPGPVLRSRRAAGEPADRVSAWLAMAFDWTARQPWKPAAAPVVRTGAPAGGPAPHDTTRAAIPPGAAGATSARHEPRRPDATHPGVCPVAAPRPAIASIDPPLTLERARPRVAKPTSKERKAFPHVCLLIGPITGGADFASRRIRTIPPYVLSVETHGDFSTRVD
jgi:hypothetical protein